MRQIRIWKRTGGNNRHPHTVTFKAIACAKVDEVDFDYLNQFHWSLNSSGYPVRYAGGKCLCLHKEVAERAGMNVAGQIDHHDKNILNATRDNLRPATYFTNQANRKLQKNSKTKLKGVSWIQRNQKYQAKLKFQRKAIFLGYFDDPTEAAKAYDEAARKHFGEFAQLNF